MDEALQKYRDHLIQADQKSQEDFDKTLLTLSSGGLGLSLVFLKDIVGGGAVARPYFILAGWTLLGLSLGLVLLGFFLSRKALRKAIDQFDKGNINTERPGGNWSVVVEYLNGLGGLLFVTGVACVVWFAFGNIHSMTGDQTMPNQSNDTGDQRGYVPPPAPSSDPTHKSGLGYVPTAPPPAAPPTQQAPSSPPPQPKE
jgi:hypothetical protein